MLVENLLALSYILPGDVFFLKNEKALYNTPGQESVQNEQAESSQPATPVQITQPQPAPAEPVAIASQPETSVVQETPAAAFNYAGGFQKKFLVLVHYPDHEIMDPAHLNALESTIKRKELSLDDVAIFNVSKYPGKDLRTVGGFFKPQKLLVLGKDALLPGHKLPVLNQLVKLGACDTLYSFSFGEMMGNKDNTKAFWEQMKAL